MTMEERVKSIINTVKTNNGKEAQEVINKDMSLTSDLGFTSLELAELTVRIESDFGVDVFEDRVIDKVEEIYLKIDE
jgi:acyl carrier protein